jgi:glycerol-3-phosphate acyltransferase PlsX
MKIAVDAMGGDYAPAEIVKGAVEAARTGVQVILVGREADVCRELGKYPADSRVEVVDAPEVIDMDEHPALALRQKRKASIAVATRLCRDGQAAAVVSAGNTGAQMAAALLILGRLPGIDRPAIATQMPTLTGRTLILDSGANADCKPHHLLQFARMGSIYAQRVLGVAAPRVGLLNIGAEETKGSELVLEAHQLLRQSSLNFYGNVEGREILEGPVDVVVCDGFVGNILLKFAEGMGTTLLGMIKANLERSLRTRIGGALSLPAFRAVKAKMDYAEYGGAPLLGVKGVSIICHGSSRAAAIKNAVLAACECARNGVVAELAEKLKENGNNEGQPE